MKSIFQGQFKITLPFSNRDYSAFSNLPRLLPGYFEVNTCAAGTIGDETPLDRSARCRMWIVTRAAGQTVKNGGEKLGGSE